MIKDSEEITIVGAVSFLCYKNRKMAGGSGPLLVNGYLSTFPYIPCPFFNIFSSGIFTTTSTRLESQARHLGYLLLHIQSFHKFYEVYDAYYYSTVLTPVSGGCDTIRLVPPFHSFPYQRTFNGPKATISLIHVSTFKESR